ncbi:MAG: sodium:solute symporter family protein [Alphaproteobacteria bacterium]
MNLRLSLLDWTIIACFLLLSLFIGIYASKKAGKNASEYFVSGRNMPWWLLGFSMVATTFSADTPNLVTNIVRQSGVFGNWQWLAFLPSGMLTVFLYSKLWRRSETITDLEFYELRYSGKIASFLRGFRAIYLGVVFNVLIMASVSLAAIKIGASMLGLSPIESILWAIIVTTVFSTLGGLRGVLLSDFILFIASISGSIAAAYFVVNMPEINGISGLLKHLSTTEELSRKTQIFGYASFSDLVAMMIIPFAIVWWSVWYPGSEPGGGGFLVQRMLAAKDEKNATMATMFFNVMHYALRPWPWILVALCSLVIYPDIASLQTAVGDLLPKSQIQNDVAYSLMLTKIPTGWIGLVVASLLAAYMSTISTHLNWGASYLVNDFYCVFINKDASEKKKVLMGRVFTLLLMIFSAVLALQLESALSTFNIILSIGAGTGLLFMLRWFWWRINALAELVAMISSFVFATYFNVFHSKIFPDCVLSQSQSMIFAIILTTICWVVAAFVGKQTDKEKLYSFYKKIRPSVGWEHVLKQAKKENVVLPKPKDGKICRSICAMISSCLMIYGVLISTGEFIYKNNISGLMFLLFSCINLLLVRYFWLRSKNN